MTDDLAMATMLDRDGQVGLRFVRHLAHPPAKVWRALTESDQLREWFPCDIVGERREGAALELPFWPDHVVAYGIEEAVETGEIRVWQPPEVFEWTWSTEVLRWELAPDGDGTRLTFTTWIHDVGPGIDKTAAGYHVCLDHLVRLLDTGSAGGLVGVETAPLEAAYADLLS